MRIKLAVIAALTLAATPLATTAQPGRNGEQVRQIEERRARASGVQLEYPGVERRFFAATKAYQAATAGVAACKKAAWGPVFKDAFKEADDTRQALEKSNDEIKAKRRGADKVLREQNDIRIKLDRDYYGKPRDDAYYDRLLDITRTVNNDYTDVMKDVVIPGYDKYSEGFTELAAAYQIYAEDCGKPLPRRAVKDTLTKVVAKIDVVKIISAALLGLVGL